MWATNLAGSYPSSCSASLEAPELRAPAGTHPVLKFWHWFQSEYWYDRGRVQISSNGGASWATLGEFEAHLGGYFQVSYDLTAYAGQTVRIRFLLTSDGSVNYPAGTSTMSLSGASARRSSSSPPTATGTPTA